MKPSHYKMLFTGLKWVFVVALGYILLIMTYHIGQGVDQSLDIGHGYVIGNFPGHLYYWPPGQPISMLGLLDQHVVGLLATDMWIIGKTEDYWFAVDKKRHYIYYPLSSEEAVIGTSRSYWSAIDKKILHKYHPLGSEKEVREITGLDVSPSELMTKFPHLSFWWPSPYEYKYETTTPLVCKVGTGYVIIVLLVTIVRRIHRRRSRR